MSKKENVEKKMVKGKKVEFIGYPVGDFLIRFKNAANAGLAEVTVRKTKLILSVAQVLKSEGYANEVSEVGNFVTVTVRKYKKEPVLLGLKLISRPGLRQYTSARELGAKRGPEIYILSTPEGVLSSKAALKKTLGGELIAKVW